jgi:hypothetical protein
MPSYRSARLHLQSERAYACSAEPSTNSLIGCWAAPPLLLSNDNGGAVAAGHRLLCVCFSCSSEGPMEVCDDSATIPHCVFGERVGRVRIGVRV